MLRSSVFHMPVGLDQPRQHDRALALDRVRARRLQVLADRGDQAVLDVHVAADDVAGAGFHRHDVGVADDEIAARGSRAGCGGAGTWRGRPGNAKRAERGSQAQHGAAADA